MRWDLASNPGNAATESKTADRTTESKSKLLASSSQYWSNIEALNLLPKSSLMILLVAMASWMKALMSAAVFRFAVEQLKLVVPVPGLGAALPAGLQSATRTKRRRESLEGSRNKGQEGDGIGVRGDCCA